MKQPFVILTDEATDSAKNADSYRRRWTFKY